jgi:hypothetical protein
MKLAGRKQINRECIFQLVNILINKNELLFEIKVKYFFYFFLDFQVSNMTITESNITINNQTLRILLSPTQTSPDRTGLFIALFLLFLLFILISYLFYSFLTFKRLSSRQNHLPNETDLHNKIIFDDNQDLINNNGEIILRRQSSFSDCGTSLRSSSIRSHVHHHGKRSSSYKLCSQPSNYLLTPRLSTQLTGNADESSSTTIIVEPHDVQLANALSRSISKYYERKRKPKLKRRTHSCEELTIQPNRNKRPLQMTSSLPMHRGLRQSERTNRRQTSQISFPRKPTTIYELYKSDRMRIANLLVENP